jgi:hypothetical protein
MSFQKEAPEHTGFGSLFRSAWPMAGKLIAGVLTRAQTKKAESLDPA